MPTLNLSPKLTLHYLEDNPKGYPTVVLLHGLGVTSRSWALQIPALTRAGFRVIVPDMRGFGGSTYPGGGYLIKDMAADVVALLNGCGIQKACLVGISMGGAVALNLVCGYAHLIDKAILVNTFARLRPVKLSNFFYYALRFVLLYSFGPRFQAIAVSRRLFPNPGQEQLRAIFLEEILQADPAGYRAAFAALARFNLTSCLSRVKTPVLVITGECDTTIPPVIQRQLADQIPGSRHIVIPGAGHAVTVEQPEAFNKAMLEFL